MLKPSQKQNALHFLFWGMWGIFFSWMWFRPMFWNMTEYQDSMWVALWDIFIWPSEPEYMLGAGIDQLGTFWIFGSLPEILHNNGHLPNIFYPIGWDIGWHTGYAWLDGILSLPLQLLGVPTFYNLHVAATLWLSFVGCCWMLKQSLSLPMGNERVHPMFALFAWGLIPLCSFLALSTPFAFEEVGMGRPTQVYWLFSYLFVGLILSSEDTTDKWSGKSILIGLCMAASCFVYWFGGVAVGFCAGATVLCAIVQQQHRWAFVLRNALSGLVAIGSVVFVASSMLLALWEGSNGFAQLSQSPIRSWSPLELPLYDVLYIHNANSLWTVFINHPSTLPVLTIGLFGAICPWGWASRWPWVIGWILSLGIPITGAIIIGDWVIPTGQGILQWLFPLLLRCEYPERMVIAPTLFSLVLGLQAIRATVRALENRYAFKHVFMVVFAIGLGLASQIQLPTQETLQVSSFVIDDVRMEIANRFPGGMIDAPFSRSENTYIQQLFHKQPLLGGPGLNRVQPQAHKDYCNANPLLKGLEELDHVGHSDLKFTNADIQTLIEDGFSVIVFDPQARRFSAEILEHFIKVSPSFTDDRTGIRAYPLSTLLR